MPYPPAEGRSTVQQLYGLLLFLFVYFPFKELSTSGKSWSGPLMHYHFHSVNSVVVSSILFVCWYVNGVLGNSLPYPNRKRNSIHATVGSGVFVLI